MKHLADVILAYRQYATFAKLENNGQIQPHKCTNTAHLLMKSAIHLHNNNPTNFYIRQRHYMMPCVCLSVSVYI